MIEPRRVYGGRYKPLGKTRKEALEQLPDYEIKLDGLARGTLNPKNLSDVKAVHLEIGSGTGEHLVHLAAQNPHDLFLCAEPFIAGTAYLVKQIIDQQIKNICTYPNDGMALLQALQTASINHAYVLFPDPWPKKRHAFRRFIQKESIEELARVIRSQGTLLLASDDEQMIDWMLMHTLPCKAFQWTNKSSAEWRTPPLGHSHSRYAAKALEAEKPLYYLSFARNI